MNLTTIRRALAQRLMGKSAHKSAYTSATSYAGVRAALLRRFPDLKANDTGLALATEASVWAGRCVELRSRAVARVPWRVINRRTGDKIDDTAFHAAVESAYLQYSQNLFYNWEMALSIHGENYLEKLRQPYSRLPGGLLWLNPIAIEPFYTYGQLLYYDYNDSVGRYTQFKPDEIVFHKYPNPLDDFRGASPLARALDAVNITHDMKAMIRAYFLNDATPGGFITAREGVYLSEDDEQRLMTRFEEQIKGVHNKFRWLLLPAPLEAHSMDTKPPDETLGESERTEICVAMSVPKGMVDAGDVKDPLSAGGTMDSQTASFWESWVIPECEDIDLVINTQIMPWLDPWGYMRIEHDFTALTSLIKRTKERSEKVRGEYNDGVISRNEARVELGYEPEPIDLVKIGTIMLPKERLVEAAELTRPQPQQINFGAPLPLPALPAAQSLTPPAALPQGGKSLTVMLSLADNPDLIALQNRLKQMVADAPVEWNAPDSFHVTLVHCPSAIETHVAALKRLLETVEVPDLELAVGSLRSFDAVGQYALHFRVRRHADLLELQESLHDLCADVGMSLSAYSAPSAYTPHVTMGYAPQKLPAVTFNGKLSVTPTALWLSVADEVIYTRPLGEVVVAQEDAEDELRAWERKALNKGARKAIHFSCEHLPAEVVVSIQDELAGLPDEADKMAVKALFAMRRAELKAETTERAPAAITADRFAELVDLWKDLGLTDLVKQIEEDEQTETEDVE